MVDQFLLRPLTFWLHLPKWNICTFRYWSFKRRKNLRNINLQNILCTGILCGKGLNGQKQEQQHKWNQNSSNDVSLHRLTPMKPLTSA